SSADNSALFTVVVSNSAGTVTSSGATLTVNAAAVAPTITTQPTAQTVTAGQSATFSVTATGTGTLSYQWQKNGVNITGGTGATTNSYTTPAMSYAGNGAVYSVVVTDSAGSVSSSNATLTVSKTSTLQSYGQVANASDGMFDKTECVQDNNTGLVWEGKNPVGSSTRAAETAFTNYDDPNTAQLIHGFGNPNQGDIDAPSNSIGYRNSVRTINLCGYNDWRLPTKDELLGIVDSTKASAPKINLTWFPNTQPYDYWSSSGIPAYIAIGLFYHAYNVNFETGISGIGSRSQASSQILIRLPGALVDTPATAYELVRLVRP
ncbi:MAG: DUF1566 domain-containing protein, partial [Rhodoferax sp.]|nr:DUF1566 domain-containing protein [Rhodoferax sp.]